MTRRETRRTRRVGWLAALLGAFVLALSVMPVTAWAAPEANSLPEAYVSANGKDETADGTQDLPFASLKEAVLAVQDGGTVYVMNDLTISKMAYVDGKSVTVDGDGHVVRRSDEFEKSQDLNRGGFNAGMFEVANEGTLRLKDITLDDAMLHEGTEFVEEKTGQDVPNKNNEAKVQSGIITAFGDGHGHVILGEGTILKNYGGLCAVRVGGNRDADGNWSGSTLLMESGSMICDDSSSVAREGGFAAVWNQGGKVEMQPDSSIEHVNGRAIYSEDGGITTVGGSISDIVSNETMKGYTGSFSGDFGGMAYYGEASTGTFELTSTGSIRDIKSHDGKAVDIAIMLVGSSFTMDKGSSITDINTVGLFNLNSGKAYINGRIENCHVGNVLFRLWGGGDVVFSLGETGEIKNCSTSDAAMLYRNGGRTTIEVNGEISNFGGTVFWLSDNNSMKNGSFSLGPTGRITACAGKAIRIDDPSAAIISGEISDCDSYAIQYGYTAGSSLKIEGTSVISGNNEGGAQIYVEQNKNPLPATDELQHVAIERGALVGNQSVSLPRFGLVTLDADYSNTGLGIAHDDAVTRIKGAVSAEHSDWTFVGTSALWFQPSEESVHFTASMSSSVKNTGLFAAYVPLDGDGKPNGNVELVEVENGSVIDVNLNGLTAGQSYALMFVNNKEYTLAPDDVTKYIGGGDGSETEGSCFPELTINGSVDLTYQENPETGEYGYDLESLTVDTDDYHATADQSLLDQLVSLLEVTYTYEDGTVATDDSKPGVYAITLGWKNDLTDGDVRVNGNNVKIGDAGTLIVRHTQDVEHAQDGTITYALLESEPAKSFDHAVAMANGLSPEFYTNDDETREADAAGVQLLDDDLLVYEGEDRRTPMEEKAAESLGEPDEGRAYRYEFHYLDLVDAYNGNAWVSASGGTTVWLPYPEGVDSTTAESLGLTVLHYKDLHREYGITGQENVDQAIADCEMEEMPVTCEANGIKFDVERSGFSPFAVVWQTKAHTITANAGNGGTIAPSGTVTVAEGADQTFAITANQGYEVADVKVDGESKGAVATYTFENVTDDHKIEATFRSTGGGSVTPSERYTITASAGEGGSISPSGTRSYAAGSDVTFTIAPDEGWTVGDVTVDGVSYRQLGSYTFEDLDDDHTISVTFMRGSDPASPDETGVSDWLNASDHMAYLHGYGDGSGKFGPENPMTRAEVAQMFYNLLLDKSRGDRPVAFEDVPEGAYYEEAVLTLASRGILNGTSPATFEPNRAITRAEFVAIAMRFSNGEFEGENAFVDVPEDAWYRDYVVGATSFGWIYGYQDGSRRFGPDDTITRGQATMVTNRMLWRSCDTAWALEHLDQVRTFVDLPQGHYAFFDVVEATNAHDYERAGGTRFEDWTGLRE